MLIIPRERRAVEFSVQGQTFSTARDIGRKVPDHSFSMVSATDGALPPITPATLNNVTADDRSSAVDFVNRVNFLFEEFDHDKMLGAFHPDAVVYHFHGKIQGLSAMRSFLERDYPYLIPGVSRHATNHIVDRDGESGVAVRYHEHLVRYAWPDKTVQEASENQDPRVLENVGDLPAIWLFTPMLDRLRKTDEGEWKIFERHLGTSSFNRKLDPSKTRSSLN
jgi:hypothetical protein